MVTSTWSHQYRKTPAIRCRHEDKSLAEGGVILLERLALKHLREEVSVSLWAQILVCLLQWKSTHPRLYGQCKLDFEKEDTNWTGREARRWIWEELGVRNERDQNTLYGILTKQNFKIMKHFVCVQIWAHAGVEQHCAKEKINGQRASPKRTGEDSLSMKTATPNGVLLYWMSADKS